MTSSDTICVRDNSRGAIFAALDGGGAVMTKNKYKVLLVLIFWSVTGQISALAGELDNKRCNTLPSNAEICKISIVQGSRTFQYSYEIKRAKPGAPTIIAIPGGPGQGLIGSMNMVKNGDFIPDEFGIILIDPRGTGKNEFGADPEGQLYSTMHVAADILEIIRQEKLSNYFIHGQSYGTAVATVLGHMLSGSNVAPARGIILTGVVTSFFDDPLWGYNAQLHRLLSHYSSDQQIHIRENLLKIQNEFGDSKRTFAILFLSLLTPNVEDASSDGKNNVNMKRFFDLMAQGAFDRANQAIGLFYETAAEVGRSEKPPASFRNNTMPEVIKCRELTRNDAMLDLIFDFEKFKLVSMVTDCQKKGYTLDRPYLSEKYQITGIPIYYIQGLLDPATPIEGAKHHFDHQQTRSKVFVQLDNYSHNALTGLWRCKSDLWKSFTLGIASFKKHIQACDRTEIRLVE